MSTAKETIKSAYQSAIDQGVNTGNSTIASKKNPIVIGGQNYGSKWNDQDAAAFNLYMSELGFENELQLLDYQNKYNSPIEQAKRMRAAGLNPDLMGVNMSESAGANQSVPQSSGGADTMSPLQAFQQSTSVLTHIMSSVQTAIKSFSDIKSGLNLVDKQEIDLTKDRLSLARELYKFYGGARSKERGDINGENFVQVPAILAKNSRQNRRWVRSVNRMWSDLRTGEALDFGTNSSAVGDEVSYNENRLKRASSPLSTDDPETDLAGTINDLRSIARATFRYQALFQKYLAQDQFQYQKEFSGERRGASDFQQDTFNANFNASKNENFDDYLEADVWNVRYQKALYMYERDYNKAMYDLLYNKGLIGMLVAISMAQGASTTTNNLFDSAFDGIKAFFSPRKR